ncbi:MAG: hypothetical protein COA84_01450 [Robiginitomaculum sp.]|nr:MAG: hypothetical protein COA84_01450 [Robiginitomaculum sp.]
MGQQRDKAFTDAFHFLVEHRGVEAEQKLVAKLSLHRFSELIGGNEPTFSETVVIAEILNVPVSSFQKCKPSPAPELEIAFAELMYVGCQMPKRQRTELAVKILELIHPDSEEVSSILKFKKVPSVN